MFLRILFLILVSACANSFAQTGETLPDEPPRARLINEAGNLPNGDMRQRMDSFLSELMNEPVAMGIIVIYGSPQNVALRERLVRNHFRFRNVDVSKINLVKGGYRNELRTEFWLVPPGAEKPELMTTARLFAEVYSMTRSVLLSKTKSFFAELGKEKSAQGFIINYGTDRHIAQREKIIRDSDMRRSDDPSRITIVRGGKSGRSRTVLWIVPTGAEVPTP